MKRFLREIATAKWLGPVIEDAAFPDDGTAWAARVAADLATGPLEVVTVADGDPRTGQILTDPEVGTPPPPNPNAVAAETLADFVGANPDPSTWTTAQLRAGLEALIKIELRRRGLL